MRTKSGGQNVGSKVITKLRRGKAGPELRVVGLRIIAREQVRTASDYVRKQGKVRENANGKGFGCGTGVNQVYSAR